MKDELYELMVETVQIDPLEGEGLDPCANGE